MSKRYLPPLTPETLATLQDQVEGLAARFVEDHKDVEALKRGFGSVHSRVKTLEEQPLAPAGTEEEEEEEHQRDWMHIPDNDVATAVEWLEDVVRFELETYQWLVEHRLPECWPWHHRVVSEMLALQAAHAYGYEAGPYPVEDFKTRWFPSAAERITYDLRQCNSTHLQQGMEDRWKVDRGQLRHLAAWWATDRDPASVPGLVGLEEPS